MIPFQSVWFPPFRAFGGTVIMNYSLFMNHGVCMLVSSGRTIYYAARVRVRLLKRREVVKRTHLLPVHDLIPETGTGRRPRIYGLTRLVQWQRGVVPFPPV